MTTFHRKIQRNLRATAAKLLAEGTTAISAANLKQITPTPSNMLEGAPKGGTAVWLYGLAFNSVLARTKLTIEILP